MPAAVSAPSGLLIVTTNIVSSYLIKNRVAAADMPGLIEQVHGALSRGGRVTPVAALRAPAVPIAKSVQRDHIVCLEDGRELRTLKRHLRHAFGLTPQQYRERWGLPADYPMVAPSYSKKRRALAIKLGLGTLHKPARRKARKKSAAR